MNNYIKKAVAFLLTLALFAANFAVASAEEDYEKGHVTVQIYGGSKGVEYNAILVNDEIFLLPEDIGEIINMETEVNDESVYYHGYADRYIDVCFNGEIYTYGREFNEDVHNVDGVYYFPLEKMLYLANAQWCVEDGIIYVSPTEKTILDFIEMYGVRMWDKRVDQVDLLMNGESRLGFTTKATLAAVFDDFDVRLFIPVWQKEVFIDEYEDAMLQLARGELDFMQEFDKGTLDAILNKSEFSRAKSALGDAKSIADFPENALNTVDGVNQLYLLVRDEIKGTDKFSKYNKLADLTPSELKTISDKLGKAATVMDVVNVFVCTYEKTTRSKEWNEDFVEQLKILRDFDQTGFDKGIAKEIKKAAKSLLIEHEDRFAAGERQYYEELFKLGIKAFVDQTPAGALTDVISISLGIAKLLSDDFATSYDALVLSNMTNLLVKIEAVAYVEMSRDIQELHTGSGITLNKLTEVRNSMMLALRVNLRNKVLVYYLNTVRNDDENWENSMEALELKEDILWSYARIMELSETEPYDVLLVADSFKNMRSDEYGKKRDPITPDVFKEGEAEVPAWAEELMNALKEQVLGESPDYLYFLPDDYDGDGKLEAFCITGAKNDVNYGNVNIWFVDSNLNCSLVSSGLYGELRDTVDTGKEKFIVWEKTAGGSGSTSFVYGYCNGVVKEPEISRGYERFRCENGKYYAETSDWSKGYHDWVTHEFKYDAESKEFVGKNEESHMTQGEDLLPIKDSKSGKWGYVDKNGKFVIEPQFDGGYRFSEGMAQLVVSGKIGFIDATGKIVIEPQFDNAYDFSEGMAWVRIDGKEGFVDKTGKITLLPQFERVNSFHDGLALVAGGGKYGYVDKTGKIAIAPQFDWAEDFFDGMAVVRVDGECGYIDKSGDFAIAPQFDSVGIFSEGLASVGVGGKYGYIDKTGKIVIEPQFDNAYKFIEGLAEVVVRGEHGFIDKTGKIVIEPQFDDVCPFSDGMALVEVGGKYGYIDKNGKIAIAPQFDWAEDFSDGMAVVRVDGEYGYIDKTGKIAIEPQFVTANGFEDGLALVATNDDKWGYINKNGEFVYSWRN